MMLKDSSQKGSLPDIVWSIANVDDKTKDEKPIYHITSIVAIKPRQSLGEEKVSTEYSLKKGNNNITCLLQSPGSVSNVTFEYLSRLYTEHNVRVSNCTCKAR